MSPAVLVPVLFPVLVPVLAFRAAAAAPHPAADHPAAPAQAPGVQRSRLARARMGVEGPLESAVLDQGRAGRTVLEGPLLPGERRELVVPLPSRPLGDRPPEVPDGVRFLGWVEDPAGPPLPPSLSARPRPPVGEAISRAGGAALALVGAGALLVVAARRRPPLALGLGLGLAAGAGAAQTLVGGESGPPPPVRVLEGDGPSGVWLQVDGAFQSLAGPPRPGLRLEARPASAPLEWRVPLSATPPGAVPLWRAHLTGGRLWRLVPLDPGGRALTPGANRWGDLAETWTRGAQGGWHARGPWSRGAPLPPPAGGSSGSGPPGWLAAGLPQGVGVLVARAGPRTWGGEDGVEPPPAVVWVRLVGFE